MVNYPAQSKEPVLPYVWIIGASAGIGKSLALLLAKHGYHVAISGRNESDLVKLHQYLPSQSLQQATNASVPHLVVPCDACDLESLTLAQSAILSKWPGIDRVIFMAGIYEPMVMSELEYADIVRIEQVIKTNLTAAFYLTKIALPQLLSQANAVDSSYSSTNLSSTNKSSINTSSTTPSSNSKPIQPPQLIFCASVAGYVGLPNGQPYSATKAALINYAESLRAEYWPQVDIKIISPGFVQTRLTDKNEFKMPMIITPEAAAEAIYADINNPKRFEIHFPRRFSTIMKLLRLLPYRVFFNVARKMR